MARQARFLEPHLPYHVTQRGNYQQTVFHDAEDRELYLNLLQMYALKYQLEIWGFCLMDNHVHLIAYPEMVESLSRTLAVTHMVYAQHLHRKTNMVGHLWQGRFYSCALDEIHLVCAVRYIEMNPVRAGLASKPEDWLWSSARHHLGLNSLPLLEHATWPDHDLLADWPAILAVHDSDSTIKTLRHATRTGRPLGSSSWIEERELRCGHPLRPKKRGRHPL